MTYPVISAWQYTFAGTTIAHRSAWNPRSEPMPVASVLGR